MYRKIIAVFMACMVVSTTLVSPVFATDYQSTYNFWNWAYDNSWFLGKAIIGSADNVCPLSDDSLHHSTNHRVADDDGLGGGGRTEPIQYTCVCDVCGQTFSAVATDLEHSYSVNQPNYKVSSDGRIYVPMSFETRANMSNVTVSEPIVIEYEDSYDVTFSVSYGGDTLNQSGKAECYFDTCGQSRLYFEYDPVAYRDDSLKGTTFLFCPYGQSGVNFSKSDGALGLRYVDIPGGVETYRIWYDWPNPSHSGEVWSIEYYKVFYFAESVDTSGTPMVGGGSISFTDDNSYNEIYDAEFMDFSTNTYHNPVTDYSTKVDNWTYDYSNREFVGYTENGEVKIVYGNEYMSVTENGNIYNYYYSDGGNGSGSGNGSGDGSDGDGLLGKLGELLGTLLGGLIELITGVLNRILDSLITLAEMTIEKLGRIVNLFGSFGDALRSLWSWLPADVIEVLVAGVTVIVFCAVIKLFV